MSETLKNTGPKNTEMTETLIGRALFFSSYMFALLGGLIMVALVVMVVVSVVGRWLFSAPIYGDFEMVAMGTAVCVFLFLPYCHMKRRNVIVDLFLSWAPKNTQTFFDVVGSVALALIAGLLAWRMTLGGLNAVEYNETTYILALPIWAVYPFAIASFALLAVACIYTAIHDLMRIFR